MRSHTDELVLQPTSKMDDDWCGPLNWNVVVFHDVHQVLCEESFHNCSHRPPYLLPQFDFEDLFDDGIDAVADLHVWKLIQNLLESLVSLLDLHEHLGKHGDYDQ